MQPITGKNQTILDADNHHRSTTRQLPIARFRRNLATRPGP